MFLRLGKWACYLILSGFLPERSPFFLESVQSPSLVEPVQSTSSSVTLEWQYNEDDPAQPAFITGYLVTVQEVLTGQAASRKTCVNYPLAGLTAFS